MNTIDWGYRWLQAIGLVLAVLFCWVILWGFIVLPDQQVCLDAGYPSVKATWDFKVYCVKRVNQTDVVVPIGAVRR